MEEQSQGQSRGVGKEAAAEEGSTVTVGGHGETAGTLGGAALIDLLSLEDPAPEPAAAAATTVPPATADFSPMFPAVTGAALPPKAPTVDSHVARRASNNPFADEQPAPWTGSAPVAELSGSGGQAAAQNFFAELNPNATK